MAEAPGPRRLRSEYNQSIQKNMESSPNTPEITDYGQQVLNKVQLLGTKKAGNAKKLASFFQYMNIGISIWIVAAAAIIFALELLDDCQNIKIVIATSTIMVAKTCHAMFQIGNRGSYFKYIYIRFNRMLMDIDEARLFLRTPNEIILFSRHIREEIDKLDIEMYQLTSGPSMITTTIDGNVDYDIGKAAELV